MKVALVYDRVNKWGGAERVLLSLHKLFPDAPLYTSVYNPVTAPWAKDFQVIPSFLQSFPFAKSSHEYYALFMPLAFESFSFDEYDIVISLTSEAAKGIITKPTTRHICYCLTPTRYLWSGYDEYFDNALFRYISSPAVSYLRAWDRIASNRPDIYVTISEESRKRIAKYYKKDAKVIYPAISLAENITDGKKSISSPNIYSLNPNLYFLIISRLVPYKRVDLAIKACNELRLPLKIIGTGSERKRLKKLAGPTVEFLGNLTDTDIITYYKNCRALLFPGKEDLGLTIIEAQSFGKPVIAYAAGGALETIIDGKTGIFFPSQSKTALIEAIKQFELKRFRARDCMLQAEKFGKEAFKKHFMSLIDENVVK